ARRRRRAASASRAKRSTRSSVASRPPSAMPAEGRRRSRRPLSPSRASGQRKAVTTTRTEHDSLGRIEVPADRYWGAQTQRSLENFPIGGERFPRAFLRALGFVKQAAALANRDLGVLDARRADAIADAAAEVAAGTL